MNQSKTMENKHFLLIFITGLFCFYFYIADNTPLTGDDWFWGSEAGWTKLNNWFENYNGRYLGNLSVILLTRIDWIKVPVMALFSTLLIVLVAVSSKQNYKFNYFLSLLLFLCIPVSIISQTFAWIAGFSNYITSIVFVLIYLNMIKNIFDKEIPTYKLWMNFSVIPLGIITQLFVEHITIYTLFMSFFVILYSLLKFRKVFLMQIIYFTSVVIGALIMFSNDAYSSVVHGNDEYRSVHTTDLDLWLIIRIIYNVFTEKMYTLLIFNNTVLNIIFSIICIVLIVRNRQVTRKVFYFYKNILLIVFATYPIIKPIFIDFMGINLFNGFSNDILALYSLVFYISILMTVFFFIDSRSLKHKLIFNLFSAVFLILPLIFVNPFGPRNFIASYTFLAITVILLINYVASQNLNSISIYKKIITSFCVLIAISYVYIFSINNQVDQERMEFLKQNINENKKNILFTRLPYEQFLWMSTPDVPGFHETAFKNFYEIPKDINLEVISYLDWKEHKN
jgi:hypothetical protein